MNKKPKLDRDPVTLNDFEDTLKQILLAPSTGPSNAPAVWPNANRS